MVYTRSGAQRVVEQHPLLEYLSLQREEQITATFKYESKVVSEVSSISQQGSYLANERLSSNCFKIRTLFPRLYCGEDHSNLSLQIELFIVQFAM